MAKIFWSVFFSSMFFICHVAFADDIKMTEGVEQDWLKTVVSVEVATDNNNVKPIGTGFLVLTKNNHVLLFTAKHVLYDDKGKFINNLTYRINLKSGGTMLIPETHMLKFARNWFLSDSADVACRFIVYDDSQFDTKLISEDLFLPASQILPGAPVLVAGFPIGLREAEHTSPIVRKGIVARSSKTNHLIDAFVFPGNSGGPVFYSPTIKFEEGGIFKVPFINRERFIGLVSSNITYIDTASSNQTKRPRVSFEENSGLSNIVPADEILLLLNRKDLREIDKSADIAPKK